MKVTSQVEACSHPGTGCDIPEAGQSFEVEDAIGAALIAAGLATGEKAAAKRKAEVKDGEK